MNNTTNKSLDTETILAIKSEYEKWCKPLRDNLEGDDMYGNGMVNGYLNCIKYLDSLLNSEGNT